MTTYHQILASYKSGSRRGLGKFFIGVSGIAIGVSIWNYLQIGSAEREIEFRK
jgi:uncharacterized membrane protein YidH (DUF202 family)